MSREPFDSWEKVPQKTINSYDIDGVIYMGKYDGLRPGPDDIVITGRSILTKKETKEIKQEKKESAK